MAGDLAVCEKPETMISTAVEGGGGEDSTMEELDFDPENKPLEESVRSSDTVTKDSEVIDIEPSGVGGVVAQTGEKKRRRRRKIKEKILTEEEIRLNFLKEPGVDYITPLESLATELRGLIAAKKLHPTEPLDCDMKDLARRIIEAKPEVDYEKTYELIVEEIRLFEQAQYLFGIIRPSISTVDETKWIDRELEREFWFSNNMLEEDEHDSKRGIQLLPQQPDSGNHKRLGWLLTFCSGLWKDPVSNQDFSCVDLYFLLQDGSMFKCKRICHPYFYLKVKEGTEEEVEIYLKQLYKGNIVNVEVVRKDSLHLGGCSPLSQNLLLKTSFQTTTQLREAQKELWYIIVKRIYEDGNTIFVDPKLLRRDGVPPRLKECIVSNAENGIPYYARFAIDEDIRCGQWYEVSASTTGTTVKKSIDPLQPPEIRVCALHIDLIEYWARRLAGPILMISYVVDGKGYLLVNKKSFGEVVEDISYYPKLGLEGHFKVRTVENEAELLRQWFLHMRIVKPHIYVTHSGDKFEWRFLHQRADVHGFKVHDEIGIVSEEEDDFHYRGYRAKFACHIDCFTWLKRYGSDYSISEAAIFRLKFYYPEDKVGVDKELRQWIVSYSVSEVVATYFMYQTCISPLIFSLAAKVPMPPDEIVRGRYPTMCQLFFRTEADKAGFVMANTFYSDRRYFNRCQSVDVVREGSEQQIDEPGIAEGTLRQCLENPERRGSIAELAAKLYNKMRRENLSYVRKEVELAVEKVIQSCNVEKATDVNHITQDLSWMFSMEGEEGSLPPKNPKIWFEQLDLEKWSKTVRSNLRCRMQWAFKDVGVSFPLSIGKS